MSREAAERLGSPARRSGAGWRASLCCAASGATASSAPRQHSARDAIFYASGECPLAVTGADRPRFVAPREAPPIDVANDDSALGYDYSDDPEGHVRTHDEVRPPG